MIERLEQWLSRAEEAEAVVFDLDGTLINSDLANFLSYKAALEKIIGSQPQLTFNPRTRITREILRTIIPSICEDDIAKVADEKERLYRIYLPSTILNELVAKVLNYSTGKEVILATNSRRERAELLLAHHRLDDKFTLKCYKDNTNSSNKYQRVLSQMQCRKEPILVFENDEHEINLALSAGFRIENVIMVGES